MQNAEFLEKPEKEENSLSNSLIATSRAMIKTITNWRPEYRKLFVMCLTKIDWKKANNNSVIELSKSEVMEILNFDSESSEQSRLLRSLFKKFQYASWIENEEILDQGFIIYHVNSRKRGKITININPEIMPHLENLIEKRNYLKMWSDDQYQFKSKFAFALYDAIQLRYDFRYSRNYIQFTTSQLKEIFRLNEKDYIRKDGQFDRTNFEKKVLNVAISEINTSQMMKFRYNGLNRKREPIYYEKRKKDGYVESYMFKVEMFTEWANDKDIIEHDGQMTFESFAKQNGIQLNEK